MKKELLQNLVNHVIDGVKEKKKLEETGLNIHIDHIIHVLNQLKRTDLEPCITARLWHDLSLSFTNLYECKGKIDALTYSNTLNTIFRP